MEKLLLKEKEDFDKWLFEHESEMEIDASCEREPLTYPCILCYHYEQTVAGIYSATAVVDEICCYGFVYQADFN